MNGAPTTGRQLRLAIAAAIVLSGTQGLSAATFTPTTVGELTLAITTANGNGQDDVIDLGGRTFSPSVVAGDLGNGPYGLPPITPDGGHMLTIRNGTISRDASNPAAFRFFFVVGTASLVLENVTLTGGAEAATFSGGAIYNSGTLSISNCVLSANTANTGGGAILNGGTLSISGSAFTANTAGYDGGAIANLASATLSATGSTFAANVAATLGGAITNGGTVAAIRNCTFSGNTAQIGGGLENHGTVSAITNSTFAQNATAWQGGGIANATNSTIALLESCIVSMNTGGDGPPDIINIGVLTTASNNLVGDGTGSGLTNGVNGNLVGTFASPLSPLLGPLANNGGPTFTHALLAGSPAIDAGSNPAALANDQRGAPWVRTSGTRTDIGAFELQAVADLSVTKTGSPNPVAAGSNLTWTITVTNAGPGTSATVSLTDTLPAGTTFVSLAPATGWGCTTPAAGVGGTVSCTIASLAPGSSVFSLTAAVGPTVAAGTVLSNTATVASTTADPNLANDASTSATTVAAAAPTAAIPALGTLGLLAMAALVGAAGLAVRPR